MLDLPELGFIDSSGIAMLFQLVRHVSARRQELLRGAKPGGPVARVLEIVGVSRTRHPVRAGVDQAIAAVDSARRARLPPRKDRVAADRRRQQPSIVLA